MAASEDDGTPRVRLDRRQHLHAADHGLGTEQRASRHASTASRTRAQGVLPQQLQDPDELPCPGWWAVLIFQGGAEPGDAGRQLPVAEHRGMVQCPRLAAQGRQVVHAGRAPLVCRSRGRAWVATTWPPATITTRST